MELSTEQRLLAEYDAGSLAVEAAPGAGKTSVIVARLQHLLGPCATAPEKLLVLTFSRRAVRELRERIALAVPIQPSRIDVRTFHGFGSRLLAIEYPGFTSGRVIERPAAEFVLHEAFATTPPEGFAPQVMRSAAFARDGERYVTDLLRAGSAVRSELARDGSPRLRDLLAVSERLLELRRSLGVVDYDDLVARAAALALDPSSRVHAWLKDRYLHVLVDEFQDTDSQQLSLLQSFNATVFAVGDAAQAIYGFRGAARNAIGRAVEALGLERRRLGASQRCPQVICDIVNAIPGLPAEQRIDTAVSLDGVVAVLPAATPLDEASLVADHVAAATVAGVPLSQIAVLLRSLDPLGAFIRSELELRSIPASLIGGDAIMSEVIVQALLNALQALAAPSELDRWLNLFTSSVFGLPRLRLVRDLHAAQPKDDTAAIAVLKNLPQGRLSVPAIETTIQRARQAWEAGDIVRAAHAIAHGFDLLGAAVAEGDSRAQRAGRRLGRTLDALEDLVRARRQLGYPMDGPTILADLMRHATQWPDEADEPEGAEVVRILTIHAAKGLEFDTVVLADAADGRIPVELRRDAIVEQADLDRARALGFDLGATLAEHLDEERSLYYVAATRPCRQLIVTYSAFALDGSPRAPSRFLPVAERDRLAEEELYRSPLLYSSAAQVPAAVTPRPVEFPSRISVTKVDDWFSCQRKFFYSAALRLPSEAAFTLTFGILVHKTLERFHDAHRRVDGSLDVATWTQELQATRERIWQDAVFDWPLERQASGASADRMLASYIKLIAADGAKRPFTVEHVEHRIERDLEGTHLIGKLDRIDRFDDRTTRIVDYKTGRLYTALEAGLQKLVPAVAQGTLYGENPPQVASVQLPLYRGAVDGAPELTLIYMRGKGDGQAAVDMLDSRANDVLLADVDAAVRSGFANALQQGPADFTMTGHLRTCNYCNFYAICDGALEAVDVEA